MPTAPRPQLQRRYTRSDPRGSFPRVLDAPDLPDNRLGLFWRPIVDLTGSPYAPMRLRFVEPVASWLADPAARRTPPFAMIGIPGLRRQVLRHAGLEHYACHEPAGLPERLRTEPWRVLVHLIEAFPDLDDTTRTLVVFQLAQLSFCGYAAQLAGAVWPTGDRARDRYAYEVARVRARVPGQAPHALAVFRALATAPATDPQLALAACAQGIGHGIRSGAGVDTAAAFTGYARSIVAHRPDDDGASDGASDPVGHLVRSRYHRAVALLRLAEREPARMRTELAAALRHTDALDAGNPTGVDRWVADENRRILLESQIKAAARARGDESTAQLHGFCDALYALDPHCVEALLVIGDGYATAGDHAAAALWYSRAGELATGAGAIGWFRAGQCFDLIGDRDSAVHAMGRCLELDASAVEPRRYLLTHAAAGGPGPTDED